MQALKNVHISRSIFLAEACRRRRLVPYVHCVRKAMYLGSKTGNKARFVHQKNAVRYERPKSGVWATSRANSNQQGDTATPQRTETKVD